MSKKSKIFYQIHECVFPCSQNSIKNARLWAYTEEEVKQAYKMHLDNSGNHSNLSKEEKEQGMRDVKVVQQDWADYEDPPSGKKRARDMWENHNAASSGAAWPPPQDHAAVTPAKSDILRPTDAEFEAWAEEVHEEEIITVNKITTAGLCGVSLR